MINTTDQILIIDEDRLLKEIKDSFIEASELVIKYSSVKSSSFVEMVKNIDIKKINKTFFKEVMTFILDQKSENIYFKNGLIEKNNLLDKPNLRYGTRLLLLSLWKKKIILLPLTFNTSGFNSAEDLISNFDNEIILNIKNDLENNKEASNYFKKQYLPNISKVIRATNYSSLSDISLEDINQLHIFILKSKKGVIEEKVPSINYYIEYFLNYSNSIFKIKDFYPVEYKKWLAGYFTRHKEFSYIEFLRNKKELTEYRSNYLSEQSKNRKIEQKKSIEKEFGLEVVSEDYSIENEFLKIVKDKKYSWSKNAPIFNDYGIDNKAKHQLWVDIFNKYINYRKNNGYETEKTLISGFNFFMNYLFFYLPLWNKENNESIPVPNSPKEFHRVLYIHKSFHQENDSGYFTIKDFLEKSDVSLSNRNSKLRHIQFFFDFIIDFYEEDSNVWIEENKNPIRKSDFYIDRRKNKKTNKVIVPKNIYSKLKKYLFSIEHFGEYLFEKSLREDLNLSVNSTDSINTEDFGFTPIFYEQGKVYPLYQIPNVFLYRERNLDLGQLFNLNETNLVSRKITSNTIIRAFILMLNTGLRAAQVSWLDRETWNLNEKNKLNAYYKINVNTDKTKDNEWTSFVSHNVFTSLTKETVFQKSLREEMTDTPVNYQNRENTRFKNILPLFRGYTQSGLPVDFRHYWTTILWTFQNNLNRTEDSNYKMITIEKHKNNKIEVIGEDKLRYSPLSIKSIYTPHSMRATFCTHMAEYLERSEIAALVGHQSDLITSEVYIKPEESTIMKKMDEALDIFDNGVNSDYFKKESVAHTKPNAKNSSLQQAFAKDRDQTIELFNISSISMNINKESEEQSKKAINLLKNSRMDHIIFETTHICPVGGICPQEVMGIIGEKRRCGLCPLALKCVDNLNPIYAKQRDLIREIKEDKAKLDKAIENNESEITLNNIEDKVNMDIRELVSWKFSADILSQHYEALRTNPDLEKEYFVEMPDMVKNHLQKVSVSNEKEYLLTRIADSNAYSVYSNGENKYQTEMIKRNVIRNLNLIEHEDYYVSDDEKIEVFCAMISNMMETNGVDLKELIEYDCFKAIEQKKEKKQLLFKDIKLLK